MAEKVMGSGVDNDDTGARACGGGDGAGGPPSPKRVMSTPTPAAAKPRPKGGGRRLTSTKRLPLALCKVRAPGILPTPPPPPPSPVTPHSSPSLSPLVYVFVKPIQRDYVKSLIALLQDNGNIKWDSQGNLLSPFTGLNIIDVLKTLGITEACSYPKTNPW